MDVALMLLGVTLFPVVTLGALMWLTHLEEMLPRDVRSAVRSPTPPPVLAVRVRQPEPAVLSVVRAEPEPELLPVRMAPPSTPRSAPPADKVFSPSTLRQRR